MKKIFLAGLIFCTLISCNFKGKENKQIEEVATQESDDIDAFEEELNDIAIGGEGILFENGVMSFDINALEKSFKQAQKQLNDIKTKYKYESEDVKKNAIESMELNLNIFMGEFCCTTHDNAHCMDAKELRKLESKYDCKRFIKKS